MNADSRTGAINDLDDVDGLHDCSHDAVVRCPRGAVVLAPTVGQSGVGVC